MSKHHVNSNLNQDRIKGFYDEYYMKPRHSNRIEEMKQDARLKVLREFAANYTDESRILIVGCGSGKDLTITEKRVFAFDLSFQAVKEAKASFREHLFFVSDGCFLPVRNDSFDCIICSEVIEHVPDPRSMIAEFCRALKPQPDSSLIITVPNWRSWFGFTRTVAEHVVKHPITASSQPIDNWYTFRSLRELTSPYFRISENRGIWYFPPTGRGNKTILPNVTYRLFQCLRPIDVALGRLLPSWGHSLAIKCVRISENGAGIARSDSILEGFG